MNKVLSDYLTSDQMRRLAAVLVGVLVSADRQRRAGAAPSVPTPLRANSARNERAPHTSSTGSMEG